MAKIELNDKQLFQVLMSLYETKNRREADVKRYPKDESCIRLLNIVKSTIAHIEKEEAKGE